MRRTPTGTICAFLMAFLLVYLAHEYRYRYVWTPLQRAYLNTYVGTSIAGSIWSRTKPYYILRTPDGEMTWVREEWDQTALSSALRASVYGGQTVLRLVQWPALVGLSVLVLGLVIGVPMDVARWRRRSSIGKQLQGTERVSVDDWNRRVRGGWLKRSWQRLRGEQGFSFDVK